MAAVLEIARFDTAGYNKPNLGSELLSHFTVEPSHCVPDWSSRTRCYFHLQRRIASLRPQILSTARKMRKLVTICTTVFNGCLQDPKRVVKYVVLCVCTVVVVYQLSECFSKLFHPPVATHSYFNLNETVSYPALTFCRNRPYRPAQMAYYNLSTHPRYTSNWRRFRFGEHDLDAVFENVTYTADDMFIIYGLDQSADSECYEYYTIANREHCHSVRCRHRHRKSYLFQLRPMSHADTAHNHPRILEDARLLHSPGARLDRRLR